MWLQAPAPEIPEFWTDTLLRPVQVSELSPAPLVYGQWFEQGRSQAHCQLLINAPGWGQLLSLKLRPGFSPPATWLQTLMQSFRLWRLECHCTRQWLSSFRRWRGTPLPLGPEHWQIFWLAAETVLAPDFHWPQPPLHRLPLPDRLAQRYQLDVLRADQMHPQRIQFCNAYKPGAWKFTGSSAGFTGKEAKLTFYRKCKRVGQRPSGFPKAAVTWRGYRVPGVCWQALLSHQN